MVAKVTAIISRRVHRGGRKVNIFIVQSKRRNEKIKSFNDVAIKAFKLNAIDYVLKPVDFEDLRSALEKVINYNSLCLSNEQLNNVMHLSDRKEAFKDKLIVRSQKEIRWVNMSDIVRLKGF